ncbi:MAG: glycosyltransferase family 4 protein [Candidatus Andersenbacteria bacterium]
MIRRKTSEKKPKIIIAMSYHNNLFDSIRALMTYAQVRVVSPRPIAHQIYLLGGIDIISGIEGFRGLLRHVSPTTDYVLIKHLHRPRNITPYLVGLIRGARIIIMVQRTPTLPRLLHAAIMRLFATFLRVTRARVFSVTEEGWKSIGHYFPEAQYIPACIDASRFTASQKSGSSQTLRLICIAKYQQRKNLFYLINAFNALVQHYPGLTFHLTIVGGVVEQAEYDHTKTLVESFKLEKQITLTRNVAAREIPQYLTRADVFILPASQEQLGYSVLEAMASGLPVLVSSDTGATSYVEHNRNGYVFAPRSEEEIVNAVASLISSPTTIDWDRIRSLGKHSLTLVRKNHSPDVFLSRFKSLLS